MGSCRRLRVVLDTERRPIESPKPLDAVVIQADVADRDATESGRRIDDAGGRGERYDGDRESRGDEDSATGGLSFPSLLSRPEDLRSEEIPSPCERSQPGGGGIQTGSSAARGVDPGWSR